MTLEIGFLFVLLAGMVYLFMTEKIPVDLTAFAGLSILILAGYLSPDEAFTGFASSAVITMLAIFMVSAALLNTGLADEVGGRVHQWVGSKEIPLILTLMLVAGVLSAFMNNIAATAVLMPAVAGLCKRAGLSPSRLFMPLSFGAILGGTTTLVGTPPNILAAEMLRDRGLEPFSLFDFTPIGIAILAVGMLFMITIGRKLLPDRDPTAGTAAGGDLTKVYQVNDQLFSIRIPEGSPLDGVTLGESKLGTALGVQVVNIVREGKKRLAPKADTMMKANDDLLVVGKHENLQELLRVQGVDISKFTGDNLPRPVRGVGGIRVQISAGSPLLGRTLRGLRFRERFNVVVVGIERDGEVIFQQLGQMVLRETDEILALGTRRALAEMSKNPEFEVQEIGLSAVEQLQESLFLIRIPTDSPLVGATIASSRIGELAGVVVGGIIRDGETFLAIDPHEAFQAGDRLVVTGEPERILSLLELGEIHLEEKVEDANLESDQVGVVEATLSPRTNLAGKTLGELEFRDRYGMQVLSVWRRGEPIHADLAHLVLRQGDALLLQGPWEKTQKLAADPDFVVLAESAHGPRRTKKAPFALGGLILMVGIVAAGFQPIHTSAFIAATLVVLSGALTMKEAYQAIEWRAIFLVAAVLPVGTAMERTGAALLLANSVTELAGPHGPYAVLAALIVLSSLLSQCLDGAPAVVLLTPVVLQAAEQLNLSPYPMMMGVGLAASAAFMTPFSHKANLLVMGAGGYKAMDYLRVGTILTIVLIVLMVVMVPMFFPFYG